MRSDFDKSSVTDTRSSLAEALIDFDAEQHTQAAQWLLSGTRRGPPTAIKIKLGRQFMVAQSQHAPPSARPKLDVQGFIKSGCRTTDSHDREQRAHGSRWQY